MKLGFRRSWSELLFNHINVSQACKIWIVISTINPSPYHIVVFRLHWWTRSHKRLPKKVFYLLWVSTEGKFWYLGVKDERLETDLRKSTVQNATSGVMARMICFMSLTISDWDFVTVADTHKSQSPESWCMYQMTSLNKAQPLATGLSLRSYPLFDPFQHTLRGHTFNLLNAGFEQLQSQVLISRSNRMTKVNSQASKWSVFRKEFAAFSVSIRGI